MFRTPPGAFSRYSLAGSDYWLDEKFFNITAASQSIPNNAGTVLAVSGGRNPEGVFLAGSVFQVPAGMTVAHIKGRVAWAANVTGQRSIVMYAGAGPTETRVKDTVVASAFTETIQSFDIEVGVVPSTNYYFSVFQNSGAALNLTNADILVSFR